jgi:hypothetical protein
MDPRLFKEVRPFSILPASLAQAANIDFMTINRLVNNTLYNHPPPIDESEALLDQ